VTPPASAPTAVQQIGPLIEVSCYTPDCSLPAETRATCRCIAGHVQSVLLCDLCAEQLRREIADMGWLCSVPVAGELCDGVLRFSLSSLR
jgi:hypothetical protein